MKKNTLKQLVIVFMLVITTTTYAQQLEKIKGSKVVTLSEIALDTVTSIELYKDIDLILKKGETDKLNIYADDNLHDVVNIDLNDGKLSLSLLKRIRSKKKFELTLYVRDLSLIILDDDSTITNTEFYEAQDITIILNNKSKMECMINAKHISLEGNDSSKSESSFKADDIEYILQDRAKVKGNSNADKTKITVGNRASIVLVGKTDEVILAASQSATAKLGSLIANVSDITTEDKSTVYINTTEDLVIKMKNASKIYFYGKAEVDLIEFKDSAILSKKE